MRRPGRHRRRTVWTWLPSRKDSGQTPSILGELRPHLTSGPPGRFRWSWASHCEALSAMQSQSAWLFSFPWCTVILMNVWGAYWKARRRDCKGRRDVTWALSSSPHSVPHWGAIGGTGLGNPEFHDSLPRRLRNSGCRRGVPWEPSPSSSQRQLPSWRLAIPTWLPCHVCFSVLQCFIRKVITHEKVLRSSREGFF